HDKYRTPAVRTDRDRRMAPHRRESHSSCSSTSIDRSSVGSLSPIRGTHARNGDGIHRYKRSTFVAIAFESEDVTTVQRSVKGDRRIRNPSVSPVRRRQTRQGSEGDSY